MKRHVFFGLLIVMLISFPVTLAQEYYSPFRLLFNVYSNGVTEVIYDLETDPTRVSIEVHLFGDHIDNLVIRDDEGLPLDSSYTETGVRVDTLGATGINMTYRTPSLTAKTELIWSFNASTSIPATIRLPLGALIFDISDIPIGLKTIDGRQHVTMNPGNLSIYYIINLPNIRDEAETEIIEVGEYLSQVKSQGVVIVDAEALLEQAQAAFINEEYLEARQLAGQARTLATATVEKAQSAYEMIESAAGEIEKAHEEGRTEGLSEVEARLRSARDYYAEGRYTEAYNHAFQAYEDAQEVIPPRKTNFLPVAIVLALVVAGVLAYFQWSKGGLPLPLVPRIAKEEPPGDRLEVDVDRIFQEHPSLRLDEKEVIRFIAECGGEAYANEIRERFDLPRSSAWRLLRRLKGEDILTERKVGNQSLFKIHENYLL